MYQGQSIIEPDYFTLRWSDMAIPTQPQDGHLSLIIVLKLMKLGVLKGMQIALGIRGWEVLGIQGWG